MEQLFSAINQHSYVLSLFSYIRIAGKAMEYGERKYSSSSWYVLKNHSDILRRNLDSSKAEAY